MSMQRIRTQPKTGEVRERELRLAIVRIQRGRTNVPGDKVTFVAVAREARVSTALIHNCHPQIAGLIREIQGRSSRAQGDSKRQELMDERRKCRELREENQELRAKVAALASINEVLLADNSRLTALLSAEQVLRFGPRALRS